MSQSSNKSSLPRLSSLPRPSRLPVSRSCFDPPPVPRIPSKHQAGTTKSKDQSSREGDRDIVLREGGEVNDRLDCQDGVSKGGVYNDSSAGDQEDNSVVNHAEVEAKGEPTGQSDTNRRRPRPSLSDRTIETLSQIPPSPSPRRRKSSFFPSESPERNPARPGSVLSRPRPSTSHGQRTENPMTAPRLTSPVKRTIKPPTPSKATPSKTIPARRAASSYVPKSVPCNGDKLGSRHDETPSKPPRPAAGPNLQSAATSTMPRVRESPAVGSKTYTPRSAKPRPAVAGAFAKPEIPSKTLKKAAVPVRRDVSDHSVDSAESRPFSPTSRKSSQTSQASNESAIVPAKETSTKYKLPSSATLRDTIAKAKAAHRKANQSGTKAPLDPHTVDDGFFSGASNKQLLRKRIGTARTDGRLNIAALGLTEIPSEVMQIYDLEAVNASGGAWYESVDITRLIAADNEFQTLSEDVFPDRSTEDLRNADIETSGTLFGSLETLDLHGNLLRALPRGLRQLEHLTSLNLSKNRLTQECFDTITQIASLHELRLADNNLQNDIPAEICSLKHLQVLDVHNNSIRALPDSLQDLLCLRILNISGNHLRSAPMGTLSLLPLVELDLSRNRLGGTLLPEGLKVLRSLQVMDLSCNALTSISQDGTLTMPELQSLNVSENRLQSFPQISTWTALTTLAAANNALVSLPDGMLSLNKLRNVDLTGNNIKKLDDGLAFMENLTMLNISNNPLRERRFLTMNTEDLKRELRNRLLPPEVSEIHPEADGPQDNMSNNAPMQSRSWPVKPGGVLDRSSTSLSSLQPSDLEPLLSISVRSVILNHNSLSAFPTSISLLGATLAALDLSHNKLTGSKYLSGLLSFPALRELNLASNTITSLEPILASLSAPRLEVLNISYNRLTTLPPLRRNFPDLTSLQASDNQIADLPVDSVRGLRICNVARNDITHLDAQLGLLQGVDGLRTLVVEGNRFRVPRREVVEGGTEKLLEWLRGRIPAS